MGGGAGTSRYTCNSRYGCAGGKQLRCPVPGTDVFILFKTGLQGRMKAGGNGMGREAELGVVPKYVIMIIIMDIILIPPGCGAVWGASLAGVLVPGAPYDDHPATSR